MVCQKKTVCVETDAQERGGIIYLPNKTKPFTGKNLCVYENGQIAPVGKVSNGKKFGKWTYWHENGQIGAEANWKDGKRDGKATEWHENGQIELEDDYKDGELIGIELDKRHSKKSLLKQLKDFVAKG